LHIILYLHILMPLIHLFILMFKITHMDLIVFFIVINYNYLIIIVYNFIIHLYFMSDNLFILNFIHIKIKVHYINLFMV